MQNNLYLIVFNDGTRKSIYAVDKNKLMTMFDNIEQIIKL